MLGTGSFREHVVFVSDGRVCGDGLISTRRTVNRVGDNSEVIASFKYYRPLKVRHTLTRGCVGCGSIRVAGVLVVNSAP